MRIQSAARAPYFAKGAPIAPQFGQNLKPVRLDLSELPDWTKPLPEGAVSATIVPPPPSRLRTMLAGLGILAATFLPAGCAMDGPYAVSGSGNGSSISVAQGGQNGGAASASSSADGNSSSASTGNGGSSASASSGFYQPPPQVILVEPQPRYVYVAPPPPQMVPLRVPVYDHCGRCVGWNIVYVPVESCPPPRRRHW